MLASTFPQLSPPGPPGYRLYALLSAPTLSNTVLWTSVVLRTVLTFENEFCPRSETLNFCLFMPYHTASLSYAFRMTLIRNFQYISQRSVALPSALPSRMRPCLSCVATMVTPRDLSNFLYPPLLTDHRPKARLEHHQYDFFSTLIHS